LGHILKYILKDDFSFVTQKMVEIDPE